MALQITLDCSDPHALDLHEPDGERDKKVAILIDLGAKKLWDAAMGPMSWITLADPEGNEFCVS
jgi:hypothetical protein